MKKSTIIISLLILIILGLCLGFVNLYSSNLNYKKMLEDYNEIKKESETLKKKIESYEEIEENGETEIVVSSDGNYDNLEIISVNDLHIKMELKEDFILLISQTGCGHCEAYKPILNKVLKENDIIAYEINLTDLTYSDKDFLSSLVKVSGTPTTLFYVSGEEDLSYRIVGTAGEEKILARLEEAGYIN